VRWIARPTFKVVAKFVGRGFPSKDNLTSWTPFPVGVAPQISMLVYQLSKPSLSDHSTYY